VQHVGDPNTEAYVDCDGAEKARRKETQISLTLFQRNRRKRNRVKYFQRFFEDE
jgi:hypothetical protein